MNGSPISRRKTIRIVIALTILAWATQTLLHQWARGDDGPGIPAPAATLPSDGDLPAEKFVPDTQRFLDGATLELRGEATTVGSEVKLKQICRWADADKTAFDPIADLVLFHLNGNLPFRTISMDELKQTLSDAGVNLAVIRFAGPTSCTVNRSDVNLDEHTALQQWIAAKESTTQPSDDASTANSTDSATPPPSNTAAATGQSEVKPLEPVTAAKTDDADKTAPKSLRELLLQDLSDRLQLPIDALQVHFNPADDKVLNLSEPTFRFNIEPRKPDDLGDEHWEIEIVTAAGNHKASIDATARAWQNQEVLVKPLSYRQVFRDEDLSDKRVLVDRVDSQLVLTRDQIIGQEASRDLQPGMIVVSRHVEPVPLVKPGQLVTVTVSQGSIEIKTVAKALEGGAFGQSIKVQNEETRDTFEVEVIGPQQVRLASGAASNVAALDKN